MVREAFALQHLLDHRQRIEEQHQQALAQAEMQLAQAQATLRLHEAARDAIAAEIAAMQRTARFDVYRLQATMQRHAGAVATVARDSQAVAEAVAHVAAMRQASIAASQDRLVLERLREAHQAAQIADQERVDAERLGELGLLRWHAKQQ